jgi:DNA-binding Lrp family transcriptional regulator
MTIRITDRDIKLLIWLNKHGYATVKQIARFIQTGKVFAYARLKKLVDNGYLEHTRIFVNQDGIYKPTTQACKLTNDNIKPLNKINLQTYQHNLKLIDLSFDLIDKHNTQFISERELRQEKGKSGIGTTGHIADGVLIINDKKIAIELELTTKSSYRLEKIINEYVKNLDYAEVWYFCSKEVKNKIASYTNKYGFFKVYGLDYATANS